MRLIKSFFIAFSIYSKIPVPQFAWKDEDMRYSLCFFPWIGAVIGWLLWGWRWVCQRFEIGALCYTVIGAAVPLLVTGGFHVDGFLDTMDAFHSYQPREKKLEILKDSHIGAFAVIMLAWYGLVYLGAFSEISEAEVLCIFCSGFFLSRALSGIAVVSFPAAKKEGLLFLFASSAHEIAVKGALYLQLLLCMGFMLWKSLPAGGVVIAAALLSFLYYWYKTRKELGGITGDTAGCFVTLCEGAMAAAAAAYCIIIRRI